MYEKMKVSIEGMSPLLMHNGHLADPLNEYAKAMKEISKKRNKTDDDYIELSRREFIGGLYMGEKGPVIPGENIEAMLISAAKKIKLGSQVKTAVLCDGDWSVEYEGPRTVDGLWADKNFRDYRGAKLNGKTTVMRTRPRFNKWALNFELQFLPDQLNAADLRQILNIAGIQIGLGDYKPKFGRFSVAA